MSSGGETIIQFPIGNDYDVIQARREGMEAAQTIGFSSADATKIAVVISELGRNIVNYAGDGLVTIVANYNVMGEAYIKIIAEDDGPGIANLDEVLEGGLSTSGGLGLGLSGSRRMMDDFEIETEVGQGTRVTAVKWLV